MASSKRKKLMASILSGCMVVTLSANSLFAVSAAQSPIEVIVGYAADDNASSLTIAELKATGVKRVVDGNLAAYKTAIANATGVGVDTVDEIQTLVDSVNLQVAIDVIKGYATADNAALLTIQQLIDAGVTSAISVNLEAYKTTIAAKNAADVDTTAKIQALIVSVNGANSTAAINKIKTYATGKAGGAAAMTIDELIATGVTGVIDSARNLKWYKAKIEVLTASAVDTISKIQGVVDAANTAAANEAAAETEAARLQAVKDISLFAANDNASALTIDMLKTAGVITENAIAANLDAYKTAIANSTAIQVDTTDEIKALIDAVNTQIATSAAAKAAAIEKIAGFAANDNASSLTIEILVTAGINNAIIANLGVHNADISKSTGYIGAIERATRSGADSTAEIQTFVDAVNTAAITTAINAIKGYADADKADALTIAQIIAAGVKADIVKVENLDFYKSAIVAKNGTDVDTTAKIQALIDTTNTNAAANAKARADAIEEIRKYAANDNASALTITQLETAGVSNAVLDNLNAYKTAIAAATSSQADTTAKIQSIINDVNTNQKLLNAVLVIKDYSGNATAMTIKELKDAGVVGLVDKYLDYYKTAVAATAVDKLDTTAKIQSVINGVNTRESFVTIISEYAGNDDASALTVADLKAAGVSNVIDVNLAQYKVKIEKATMSGADTTAEIQVLIDAVNQAAVDSIIAIIKGYAKNDNASALTIDQLNSIGLTNVIAENLNRYKEKIAAATEAGADSKTEIQALIDAANADAVASIISQISAFAGNDNADNLTIEMLKSIGITNVVSANLARYKSAIVLSTAAGADSKTEIQTLIDNANAAAVEAAINVIKGYAALDDASDLTIDKLAEAGVKTDTTLPGNIAAIPANLNSYKLKIALLNAADVDTTTKIQSIITAINNEILFSNSLNIIINYATNDNADALTIKQLQDIGIAGLVNNNLSFYKTAIAGKSPSEVDTVAKVQNVIDSANALVTAIVKVTAYADDASAMQVSDLTAIGIINVLDLNLNAYKAAIVAKNSADVDTIAEIQKLINDTNTAEKGKALTRIMGYAANDDASALTIEDLVIAGVSNATLSNLDLYKDTIKKLAANAVDTTDELQAIVSSINKDEAIKSIKIYAGNDDATMLTIAQLQAAGVAGAKDSNIAAYRIGIARATLDEVDTTAEIQQIIDSINAQIDEENTSKTVAGIKGITVGSIQGAIPVGSIDSAYLPVLTINFSTETTISAANFIVEGQSKITLYTDNAFSSAVNENGIKATANLALYSKVVSFDGKNTRYYKVVFNIVDTNVKRHNISATDFVKVGSNYEANITIDRGNAPFLNDPKLLLIYTLADGQTQVYITQNAVMGDNTIVVGAGVTKVSAVLVDGKVDWTDPNSPNTKSLFVSLNFPASN